MDYIIFGIGSSATLVLAGWALRDWGPRLRDRKPPEDEVLSASDLVTRMAWARFCAACGMAILICGALLMLATLGAAFFAPSDRAATIAVISTFGLAVLLMLVWTGLYLRQFGAFGIIRPREKRVKSKPLDAPEPAVMVSTDPAVPLTTGATGEAAPLFAETAADRGGLRRFAAFFRKDAIEDGGPIADILESAPVPDAGPEHGAPAMANDSEDQAISPTEAVIAGLSGGIDDAENKRLSADDPLVTSVRALPGESSSEEALADMLGPEREDLSGGPTQAAPGDVTRHPTGDALVTEPASQEFALSQLRRRRLSRLSNPVEPK